MRADDDPRHDIAKGLQEGSIKGGVKPPPKGPRPEGTPAGQEGSPVEKAEMERLLLLMAKEKDPGVGRLALELVLIDDDRDKLFRSGRLRATWLRSAHREVEKVHGIDAAEELLQSFTREVIREIPRGLRKLFEDADLIPKSSEAEEEKKPDES